MALSNLSELSKLTKTWPTYIPILWTPFEETGIALMKKNYFYKSSRLRLIKYVFSFSLSLTWSTVVLERYCRRIVGDVLLNIKTAYDNALQFAILDSLQHIGVGDLLNAWVVSYLCGRTVYICRQLLTTIALLHCFVFFLGASHFLQ